MGQSLVKNYVHLVFSTKCRQPLIYPPYEKELHGYLGGICRNLECQPIKIGGYIDHIHILVRLSQKIALMKLVEKVKSHSSKWMKTKDESLKNFYSAGQNTPKLASGMKAMYSSRLAASFPNTNTSVFRLLSEVEVCSGDFYWQDGYGAFSVDYKGVDGVTDYIANQYEHHHKKTFKEEFLILLKLHKIEFDESYVWE